MPAEPQIQRLSLARRTLLFWVLVTVFVLALPALIFYTTGHRLTLGEPGQAIVTTGGLYVSTLSRDAEVYLNEQPIEHPRLFRSAFYIQNISAGRHRLVVQEVGAQTWVKELPVDPYLVTEAAAFNVPLVPQVRPITQYVSSERTPVVFASSTNADPFGHASVTVPYLIATSTPTARLQINEEYEFADSLFGTTSTSSDGVIGRIVDEIDRFRFASVISTTSGTSSQFQRVVESGNVALYQDGAEVYARYTGNPERIPYYFCVASSTASTTAYRYGEHVAEQITELRSSSTLDMFTVGSRVCRSEIRIDRKWQPVRYFHFVPGSSDLVILQLSDGVYVVEIDDRAWQNTQLLYPGTHIEVVVHEGGVFVRDGTRIFEVYPIPQDF